MSIQFLLINAVRHAAGNFSRSKRDSADHSRLDRNEWRNPVKVKNLPNIFLRVLHAHFENCLAV